MGLTTGLPPVAEYYRHALGADPGYMGVLSSNPSAPRPRRRYGGGAGRVESHPSRRQKFPTAAGTSPAGGGAGLVFCGNLLKEPVRAVRRTCEAGGKAVSVLAPRRLPS